MAQMNFSTHDTGFILALVFVVSSSIFGTAYGQDIAKFGHRLLPEKMLENSEGVLETYAVQNNGALPHSIKDLIARSSDPSVVEITGVKENENGFITDVKIKAVSAGTASIAFIAPGFSSDEFPITVYSNQNTPTQLLLKATTSSFSLNGPPKGYVTVELANSDGYPVSTNKDTAVTLSLNDNSLLDLKNNQLVIKEGDYFAIAEFNVKNSGIATLFANAQSMKTTSSQITIDPDAATTHLQLYVYPDRISSFAAAQSYAIVQLQNANGVPVKAMEDIFVSVKITDSSQKVGLSSSSVAPNLSADNLVINQRSYLGYSTLTTLAGVEGSYGISIASNNYPSSDSQQLDVVNVKSSDNNPFQFDTLPVLVTGQKELIGVLHLVDPDGNPLLASNNLLIKVDSTDKSSISVKDVKINKGLSSGLVFADMGLTAANRVQLYDTTDNSKLPTPKIYGPTEETLTLVAEPLIPQLVTGIQSPLLLYMLDNKNSNSSSYFPDALPLSISNTALMQIESKTITKGQDSLLLDTKALKAGTADLSIIAGSFESDPTVTILSPKASQVHLSSPDSIITNLPSRFSLELLDENGLPAIAEDDKKITLIPNDKSVIEVPESITIKKGDYYTIFNAKPLVDGNTELSIISDGLPLLKSDLGVTSLNPNLSLSAPNSINASSIFDARVNAQYDNAPLSGLNVEWKINGAQILAPDSITDQDGNVKVRLLAVSSKIIVIQATVSGGVYADTHAEQVTNINQPLGTNAKTPNSAPKTNAFDVNRLIVIIPVIGVASFIILKKRHKLASLQIKNKLVTSQIKNRLRKKALLVKEKIRHVQAN